MQQVNVNVVGVQAFEAGFGFLGQDLLGEAQGLPTGGSWRGFGGDHHLAAPSGHAVPQCGFGPSHAVAFGGVEEVDADVDAVPYQLVSLDVPALTAEMPPEGRALAEPGDVEVGVAELHQVRGTACGFGRRWRLLATGQWSQHYGAGSRSTGFEEGPAIGLGVDVLGKQGTLGHCGLPFWNGFIAIAAKLVAGVETVAGRGTVRQPSNGNTLAAWARWLRFSRVFDSLAGRP